MQHNHLPPGNSVSASTASDRLLPTKPPSQPQCQKCRRCMLKGYRNQFNTHIVDSTYGTIGEHNDAILLANWTRLQFVARRHIQRFGLRRHIGNVYDSLLDDLKREIRLQRFGIIGLNTTPPPATTTHLTFYRPSGGLLWAIIVLVLRQGEKVARFLQSCNRFQCFLICVHN